MATGGKYELLKLSAVIDRLNVKLISELSNY